MTIDPGEEAHAQYAASTLNLDRRVAIHSFGANPVPWPEFVRAHLPMCRGDLVVDVGAGTGVHWEKPTEARPVLVDLHSAMCAALVRLGHPVVQASAEALPFRSQHADGVLCTHVLYHVPDPLRAVDEMLRVVRPGGWVAVASNGPRHMRELDDLRRAVGVDVGLAHHAHFGIDDVFAALAERGCRPVRHDYEDHLELARPEPVVDYCRSLGRGLTDAEASGLTALVRRHVESRGHLRVSKETALVVGRR